MLSQTKLNKANTNQVKTINESPRDNSNAVYSPYCLPAGQNTRNMTLPSSIRSEALDRLVRNSK